MMKFVILLIFMMPSVLFSYFWLIQFLMFLMIIIFVFYYSGDFFYQHISFVFGLDLLSWLMVLLSFWICALMLMSSSKLLKTNYFCSMFLLVLVVLLGSLVLTFFSLNLFVFYLFFEISLIPTLFLILGWGYQPERLQAGVYLFFYTMFASLPMLISIFYVYSELNSLMFFILNDLFNNLLMFLCMNFVFLVKIPMFFVHLWLPKAHVEAPVSGSMILAGVMLKLGGYGLIRLLVLFQGIMNSFNYLFVGISMLGGLIVSLICLRQSDIKSLIAYSSVAHMGLVLSGIMSYSLWGFMGAILMMIAHGLSSSGLFCLANINYERLGSRSLFLNKGLMNLMPTLTFWWFMFSASNMAAPPSLNLMGEVMLINSLVGWSSLTMLFLSLMSFFSACYSLYLYSFSQHGIFSKGLLSMYSGQLREYLLLALHLFPLNVFIIGGFYLVL
uniref:NADH dehydrogenase subunit 4 n=1 Tax=Cantonius szechuanensis TaxID=3045900 RepID=UPI00257B8AE8|nr:NADH dehydrogenase subunit 4 [Cantonius szechuanensis]WHE42529.1 NADH dehydrogenase subunit 4 [Cantonius szechuanensis]